MELYRLFTDVYVIFSNGLEKREKHVISHFSKFDPKLMTNKWKKMFTGKMYEIFFYYY